MVAQSLAIQEDFTWSLKVHGVEVDGKRCPSLSMFENLLSHHNVNQLIEHLVMLQVCTGHPDAYFIKLANAKGNFKSANGQTKAILDSTSIDILNGDTYSSTVRVVKYEMLVASGKCHACIPYCCTLRTMYNTWMKNNARSPMGHTSSSSHLNII